MFKLPFFKKKETSDQIFESKPLTVSDVIAPSAIKINPSNLKLGEVFSKTYFIFSYPRYLHSNWLSSIINLAIPMDVSLFIHPIDTSLILKDLRKKITETQSEMLDREEKGLIRDPQLEIAYRDMEELRDKLQTAQEKMFDFGFYITVYGESQKKLKDIEITLRSILEPRLIYIREAFYRQNEGFLSTGPYGLDKLQVSTTMNTQTLSSAFPFVSFDLSSNEGILYGINQHNNSLVLFDRFNLPNANEVIFAQSGAGKSYFQKLEIMRYLMLGADIIVIDPENEYKALSDSVGGSFFNISLSSKDHINLLDLPQPREDEKPADVIRSSVINLVGLMRIMLGGLTPEEDSIMDQALTETYAAKDITPESDPATWATNIPLLSDLAAILETMEGGGSLLNRLRKFTLGTYSNFFNQPSNISLDNNFVVFGLKNMEDSLRPIAMFIIMRYIWNTVRSEFKKRILVIDEAWWIMQYEDGASFLYGVAKRARKYWLGLSTISQDIGDFMKSEYGKPIITNSSLQLLMKQSSATIDTVQKTFNLTDQEKYFLLNAQVGEGLFFAGDKHVMIRSVASYAEDQIITTTPEQVQKILMAKQQNK